jgi:Ca-activated chloride channel homolog
MPGMRMMREICSGGHMWSGTLAVRFFAAWILAGLALVQPTSGSAQSAADRRPALVVAFDGSGSMWGRIDGARGAKFEVARDGLRTVFGAVSDRMSLGLVTFGARSRGACSATTLVAAPGAVSGLSALDALDRFNPQSRGPVVLGLETAFDALQDTQGPRDILLIHDDPDNCGQDLCSTLEALHRATPGVRVSSLFLTPKETERGSFSCLSKTGGRVYEVDNAEEVQAALKDYTGFIMDRAGPQDAAPRAAESTPGHDRAPPPQRARPPTPGLMLSAVLVEDGPVLTQGIAWRIERKATTGDDSSLEFDSPTPSVALPPGNYDVEVHAGDTTIRQAVTVEAGPRTIVEINLNAARISFSAHLAKGQTPLRDASFTIEALKDRGTGEARADTKPIWQGTARSPSALLAAGDYRITARAGRLTRHQDVSLKAGDQKDYSFEFEAGRLSLKAVGDRSRADTGTGIVYEVEADDPSQPSGRRAVARSAAAKPSFLLPAGTYYVTAHLNGARAQELIAISPGDEVVRELVLRTMALTVRPRLMGLATPMDASVETTIWRLDGDARTLIARSQSPEPRFHLPPGRYRILNAIGHQNARIVRDFNVGPDRAGDLPVEHQAGILQLSAADASAATGDRGQPAFYWKIHDSSGRSVFRSIEPTPVAILTVGTYIVLLETGETQFRDTVVVTSGQTVQLTMGAAK